MATSYYAKLDRTELKGQKLLTEFGSAKFVKKATVVSLTTEMSTVRFFAAGIYKPNTAFKTSGICLYCSGTVSAHKFYVRRSTLGGTMSGANFWYYVVGY